MNPLRFHPDHLKDLEKSGLTPETIEAAGVYTVRPADIGKAIGGNDAGIASALAFPYPGCNGYERYKLRYLDGASGPKYRQKAGTSNRLYTPPGVDLAGDSPLMVVEGEKKTLALVQAGIQAVGIGGVWNWCKKAEGYKRPKQPRPIADLDRVNWKRPVTILFDSDGHDNRNVRLAALRLARELARRGAEVSIAFVPPGPGGEKAGADDYLLQYGDTALRSVMAHAWPFDPALNDLAAEIAWQTRGLTPQTPLPDKLRALAALAPTLARLTNTEAAAVLADLQDRLKLRAADVQAMAKDVNSARKAREKASKGGAPAPDLGELEDIRRCHPAMDFLGGISPQAMTYGFRVPLPDGKEGVLLVISDGRSVQAEVNVELLKMEGVDYQISGGCPPLLEDVWTLAAIKSFVAASTRPSGLYQDLVAAFKSYLDLQDPAAYGFMAAWATATYLSQIFAAVPFIHFYGPKESGKSKALEALRFTCFNAYKGRDITAAALGDTVDGMRGTVLIDQAERLGMVSKAGESTVNLVGLLADSYKKAGGRRRVIEMSAGGRRVLEFSTFGFKGFASTKSLDPDLADRCIPISMIKTGKSLPDLEGYEPIWANLRDQAYRFSLGAFQKVAAAYQATMGDGTRMTERWRPIAAVLTALDVGEAEFQAIKKFFMSKAEESRHVPDGWELSLLEALEARAVASPEIFEASTSDLIEAMQVDGKEKPGTKWLGDTLARFSLFSKKSRPKRQGIKVTTYIFQRSRVLKIIELFLYGTPQDAVAHVSHSENTNESKEFDETRENQGTRPILSPLEKEGQEGHDGICPPEMTYPHYHADNIAENGGGHEGHEKSGWMDKNNYSSIGVVEGEL
jgi:hypothetical protein